MGDRASRKWGSIQGRETLKRQLDCSVAILEDSHSNVGVQESSGREGVSGNEREMPEINSMIKMLIFVILKLYYSLTSYL